MISIIIPAYNAVHTLQHCVESVLTQTYTDFELILIDDGSKDSTAELCDSFCDERIRVFHKVNGGVSSARNMGLDNAKGDYVSFIDADDSVASCYLQDLMKGSKSDLATIGYSYGVTPPYNSENAGTQYNSACEIASELPLLICDDRFCCFPWGRLYRRSIIEKHHLRFDENMRFAEDNVFVWEYLCHVNSMYVNLSALDYHRCFDEAKRYNLSLEEMDYIDGCLFEQSKKLESHFGLQLELQPHQLMHVSFLKDKLQLTACQWYEYYKKYHPRGTEKEGYAFIMQAVYYMSLMSLAETKNVSDKKQILAQLNNFIDKPLKMLTNSSIKSRFLIPLIKLGLDGLVLKMIDKLK